MDEGKKLVEKLETEGKKVRTVEAGDGRVNGGDLTMRGCSDEVPEMQWRR